jgi:uncharacterized protein YycO
MSLGYIPRLGDIGIVKTGGYVGAIIRIETESRFNHAFIYVGNGKIVEATPKGIIISDVSKYPDIIWNEREVLTQEQREGIAKDALALVGKPYSFITIAIIQIRILGLKNFSNSALMKKLSQKEGYLCSEMCAEIYVNRGKEIYGNKPDYLVVPGDIAEHDLRI